MKPPGKKETLLDYLGRGIAMLHVDARRPGVLVPHQHVDDPHLRINLSFRYGIPDLVIDERRVQATLSFGGKSFQCQLPWTAVFGITSQSSGDGQIWPEDLPTEVMPTLAEASARRKGDPPKTTRPALVAVESDDERAEPEPPRAPLASSEPAKSADAEGEEQPPDQPPTDAPKRNHLRIVR